MQIVIDIDKDVVYHIINGNVYTQRNTVRSFQDTIADAIKNGTPLPEGHGKLIDVNSIISVTLEDSLNIMTYLKGNGVDCQIEAPTIIEADK